MSHGGILGPSCPEDVRQRRYRCFAAGFSHVGLPARLMFASWGPSSAGESFQFLRRALKYTLPITVALLSE